MYITLTLDFKNPFYVAPIGTPLYWKNDSSGMLPRAVEQYIYWVVGESSVKPSESQLDLIKQYLKYWIDAPCWQGPTKELKQELESVNRAEDLEKWLAN